MSFLDPRGKVIMAEQINDIGLNSQSQAELDRVCYEHDLTTMRLALLSARQFIIGGSPNYAFDNIIREIDKVL